MTNPKDVAGSRKVSLNLLPVAGVIEGARACEGGAAKYGPYNWRDEAITLSKYLAAIERHLAAIKDGEDVDPQSKCKHLGHMIATCAIVLDAEECGCLIDDRSGRPGPASVMLARYEKPLEPEDPS